MISRPMLAASLDTHIEDADLTYPLLSSPKIDGIRCLIKAKTGPLSRSFKQIPNLHIRQQLESASATFLDGELITLTNKIPDPFNNIQSKVMSFSGAPDFIFLAFDYFETPSTPFELRLQLCAWRCSGIREAGHDFIRYLPHSTCRDHLEVMAQEARALRSGFEGLMLRNPQSPYKSGRSTLREAGLIKIKRFQDAEGIVIGVEPLMTNENEQKRDAFGLAKRSSHQSGKQIQNKLGALILQTGWGDLAVGSGFTQQERKDLWTNPPIGLLAKFKFLPHGMKDKPRHPIFLGFRHAEDT